MGVCIVLDESVVTIDKRVCTWEQMKKHLTTSYYLTNVSRCYYIHIYIYIYIATTFALIRAMKKVNKLTTKTTNLCHRSKRTWVYKAQSANHNWLECKQTRSGGSKRKSSARTIRLTARRSFPHVFITASSCVSLFKFAYRSSFCRLTIHSTSKTKELKKKDTKKTKQNMCMRGTRRTRPWDSHQYIHKRIAGGWKDRKKTGLATKRQ
jgi:hypothetical protein